MRYFFDGKIEREEDNYIIRIPFNVWEVCKPDDVIKADILMDNRIIYCELIHEDKGNYYIPLSDADVADTDISKVHKILLNISVSLIKEDVTSPYSLENPIRKIDDIDIIIQPIDGTCGQTVVAMLAGNTIAEVCTAMGCREWQATMWRVISALNYYGIGHSDIIVYTQGREVTLPKCAVLMERMGRFCHYLLYFDGKYYDPNDGIMEEYDQTKLLGYLEIKLQD